MNFVPITERALEPVADLGGGGGGCPPRQWRQPVTISNGEVMEKN